MTLSRDELHTLLEPSAGPCVSIFLPTERAGKETRQGAIRLKNLLREAEAQLTARGLRSTEALALLEPAAALLADQQFWQHQEDGLALFCAPDFFRSYRLPLALAELLVVGDRFHVKPLLPLLTNDGRFYILALSQGAIRLLEGSRQSVREVELETVPRSIEEALQYDDPEKELQFYTGTPGANTPGGGDRPAVFYGTGAAGADQRKDLVRYLQRVDKALVDEVLHDERAPLVLAGVDYLLPIYHEVSSYNHVLEAGVTGNPDTLRPDELHAQAWEVVAPHFAEAQHAAAEQYHVAQARSLATHDLRTIIPAALDGRIDKLFVALGQQRWGSFDAATRALQLHAEAEPGDEDLLDYAAVHTFLNGGTVYAVEPHEVPEGAPAAAVVRY